MSRDVALGAHGPARRVSGALQLDQPRALVKAALGRSDDDEIDTEIALRRTADGSTTPAPPPTRKLASRRSASCGSGWRRLARRHPGVPIVEAAAASPVLEPVDKSTAASRPGSSGPTCSTGSTTFRVQVRKLRPKAVMLGLGGNDDHGYMTGLPEGRVARRLRRSCLDERSTAAASAG